ncbi:MULTISPECIES: hypothetical protein [Bacillus]|uniref:hypothetical protein n=1 Tax=Bacillus TaxID=1386 RepID=UPI00031BA65C|nr:MULTISPECIES: hypothetical protein [Bacillus]
MLFKTKIQTIKFQDFMKKERINNASNSTKRQSINYSFIPLHPAMFIDSTFIMIAGGVVLVALLERTLANYGHVAFAEAIYTFLKIAFPIVGLAAMYVLISQLSFF